MKASFGYISDNGTTYQLAWESANEAIGAGALPAPVTLNPLYPALWIPRRFVAIRGSGAAIDIQQCICLMANAVFLGGPGTSVTIGGLTYTVTECLGESREDR